MEYEIRVRVHSSFENSKFPKFYLLSPLDFDIILNMPIMNLNLGHLEVLSNEEFLKFKIFRHTIK